jgi:hypothetical protein
MSVESAAALYEFLDDEIRSVRMEGSLTLPPPNDTTTNVN